MLSTLTNTSKLTAQISKVSDSTYVIPISDVRKSNQIFAEHKSLLVESDSLKQDIERLNSLVQIYKNQTTSFETTISDLNKIIDEENSKYLLLDTYTKEKIKSVRKQRNRAYIVGVLATLLTVLSLLSK